MCGHCTGACAVSSKRCAYVCGHSTGESRRTCVLRLVTVTSGLKIALGTGKIKIFPLDLDRHILGGFWKVGGGGGVAEIVVGVQRLVTVT